MGIVLGRCFRSLSSGRQRRTLRLCRSVGDVFGLARSTGSADGASTERYLGKARGATGKANKSSKTDSTGDNVTCQLSWSVLASLPQTRGRGADRVDREQPFLCPRKFTDEHKPLLSCCSLLVEFFDSRVLPTLRAILPMCQQNEIGDVILGVKIALQLPAKISRLAVTAPRAAERAAQSRTKLLTSTRRFVLRLYLLELLSLGNKIANACSC